MSESATAHELHLPGMKKVLLTEYRTFLELTMFNAVEPGRGWGSIALRDVKFMAKQMCKPVLLYVIPPRIEDEDPQDYRLRQERVVRFYERNGFHKTRIEDQMTFIP